MQTIGVVDYAALRAAALFCEGQGRTLATSGIHLDKTNRQLQATNNHSLIQIPCAKVGAFKKSYVIKPQGWFGSVCSYVKIYQDGHEKSIGFMRGYTKSGTPIQKDGFDRLIPVIFIDEDFPNTAALNGKFGGISMPHSELALDADILARVGKAVSLLTHGTTTQIRMRFYGDDPVSIRVTDTRRHFCRVLFHSVRVNNDR